MHQKKSRSRTGCLSCRARRVKCDERKPVCRRCESANVDCAGYEQKRHVEPRPQQRAPSSTSPSTTSAPSTDADAGSSCPGFPVTRFRQDGLPLVGLPSNPRSGQRPGPGARHVLGYHQSLFRTLPVLFPENDLYFWRDQLCEEAWGAEYIYLTLTALGNLHRAMLMISTRTDADRDNGQDYKVTAVHVYTQALQELSDHIQDALKVPEMLVAVLCLMAYFEALNGNIPGCRGHVKIANHYFTTLVVPRGKQEQECLRACLRSLGQVCRIAVSFPQLPVMSIETASAQLPCATASETNPSNMKMLQSLLEIVRIDKDMEQLIWTPLTPYMRRIPEDSIYSFQKRLRGWRHRCLHMIPELDSDDALENLLRYEKKEEFVMPPISYSSVGPRTCIVAAHYNFYMARLMWALTILDEDTRYTLSAEFYFYEALRFATTHASGSIDVRNPGDSYIPRETTNAGFLPLLHITAQCSPTNVWVIWIRDLCAHIELEGMFKGHTYSTNLDCLLAFEVHNRRGSSKDMEHLPGPTERVICQLIPETDGRHYISYFASPRPEVDADSKGLERYQVLGHARWKCSLGEAPCYPIYDLYFGQEVAPVTLSKEWLLATPAAQSWMQWSTHVEFDMNRALRDHIGGTRLLPLPEDLKSLS